MFSACGSTQTLKYNWILPDSINTTGINLGSANLVLPKDSLPAGLVASEFQLQAWAEVSPTEIGKATLKVTTNFPELRCNIDGVDGQRSTLETTVLDASASSDPAGRQIVVEWTCSKTDGTECIKSDGQPITASIGTFGMANVANHSMLPSNTYEWTATLRDAAELPNGAAKRLKTCSVEYTMAAQLVMNLDLQVPAEISTYKLAQFIAGTTVADHKYDFTANTDQDLQLTCKTSIDRKSVV